MAAPTNGGCGSNGQLQTDRLGYTVVGWLANPVRGTVSHPTILGDDEGRRPTPYGEGGVANPVETAAEVSAACRSPAVCCRSCLLAVLKLCDIRATCLWA